MTRTIANAVFNNECNILCALSFRPKAQLCRAEVKRHSDRSDAKHREVEESISIASPKANQKVRFFYWKRH